jgi:RNA polymerase sigma factor (sigma-70 family)
MVASQASKVFHCVCGFALRQHDGATDGDLLNLYVRQKDEAAFEALVRRHGPMVLGLCRRILGNSHDAEDAFQATFLVLVRKAASIRPAGMIGNWLYGVARRTALEARRSAAKRRAKEAQVEPSSETPDDNLAHLRPLLDQELDRLPDKYRAVLVLCDLEGRTRKEAAQQLGLPEGTIASRQARARTILAKRLTGHGVTLSGGVLAAALTQETASASAPLSLVFATVKAATAYAAGPATAAAAVSAPVVALTEGVLRTMLLSKLKITALLLVVIGLAGTGLGGVSFRAAAKDQPAGQTGQHQDAQADRKTPTDQRRDHDAAKSDLEKLQGSWRVVSSQVGEEKVSEDEVARRKVTIKGDKLIYDYGNEQKEKQEGTIKTDPKTKAFDWTWAFPEKGATMLGIYELKGDDLKICFGNDGLGRPKQFVIGKEDVVWLLVLKRDKAEQKEKKAPEGKNPPDQAEQALDMVLKGYQAYWDSKGKKPADQDLAKFLWGMMEKSYRPPDGKKAGPADKEALDHYKEAFLLAYRIAYEIAWAMAKGQAKMRLEDEAALDACGPAFVQAYERAKSLKKSLQEQKASGGKGYDKSIEALDAFLKAGRDFEQAVKLRAKAQAVQHVRKEIENAVSRVEKTAHDQRTALEALEEIERTVKDMRTKLQQKIRDGASRGPVPVPSAFPAIVPAP